MEVAAHELVRFGYMDDLLDRLVVAQGRIVNPPLVPDHADRRSLGPGYGNRLEPHPRDGLLYLFDIPGGRGMMQYDKHGSILPLFPAPFPAHGYALTGDPPVVGINLVDDHHGGLRVLAEDVAEHVRHSLDEPRLLLRGGPLFCYPYIHVRHVSLPPVINCFPNKNPILSGSY